MSFNLNANIDFNKTGIPLKRCEHSGVTAKYDEDILHVNHSFHALSNIQYVHASNLYT